MKDILKIELKRAFKSKGMLLAVLIGCILAIAQVIEDQIPAYFRNETMDFASIPIVPPSDVSGIWMAGNSTNLEVFIFFPSSTDLCNAALWHILLYGCRQRISQKYLCPVRQERIPACKIPLSFYIGRNGGCDTAASECALLYGAASESAPVNNL